jgi:hypothetical protein
MEIKYKKFVDNGNGDCVYCRERRHDCCCSEETAKALGYHYDEIVSTVPLERPSKPTGLSPIAELAFFATHPTSKKMRIGIWRKGKHWFRNSNDLVDYHNSTRAER